MTVAAAEHARRSPVALRWAPEVATAERPDLRLARACAGALLIGAGVHAQVGLAHGGTTFATLSLLAAAAQLALGIVICFRPVGLIASAALLIELVLLQLYLLNVTVGLPPAIAHSHLAGEHVVLGYTLALPNPVDVDGVIAVVSELVGTAWAVVLLRKPSR